MIFYIDANHLSILGFFFILNHGWAITGSFRYLSHDPMFEWRGTILDTHTHINPPWELFELILFFGQGPIGHLVSLFFFSLPFPHGFGIEITMQVAFCRSYPLIHISYWKLQDNYLEGFGLYASVFSHAYMSLAKFCTL